VFFGFADEAIGRLSQTLRLDFGFVVIFRS
jgi:hypothetical protein